MNYIITIHHESGETSNRPFGADFISAARFYDHKVKDFLRQTGTEDDPVVAVKFIAVIAEVNESNTLSHRYG